MRVGANISMLGAIWLFVSLGFQPARPMKPCVSDGHARTKRLESSLDRVCLARLAEATPPLADEGMIVANARLVQSVEWAAVPELGELGQLRAAGSPARSD